MVSFLTKQSIMEEVLSRFPYIGEDIFDQLDEKSLENCKKVCRIWKNFIEDPNQKFMWIQIIKGYEKDAFLGSRGNSRKFPLKIFIRGPNPKWSKLQIQDLKKFVNRLNSEKDKSNLIEMFLEKYAELKVGLNGKTLTMTTIFHCACIYGQSELVNILIEKSADLKIDLNARDIGGRTAFHDIFGIFGRKEIAAMIIENAELLKIDLKIEDNHGRTAFQYAQFYGRHNIVDFIKRKLPAGTF